MSAPRPPEAGVSFEATAELKNTGLTPALEVISRITIMLLGSKNPPHPGMPFEKEPAYPSVLGPGSSVLSHGDTGTATLTKEDVDRITADLVRLCIVGWVTYTDGFETKGELRYRAFYKHGMMVACELGTRPSEKMSHRLRGCH